MGPIEEIAYIAGIFDGEGCVYVRTNCRSIDAQIDMTDLDILERVKIIFGGTIYGPYNRPDRKPIYIWRAGRREQVWKFLDTIYPLLGYRRQTKIDNCEKYRINEYTARARALRDKVVALVDSGLSQARVAKELGYSQSYISNLYNGLRGAG